MFINANEVIKLIEVAKECQKRLPENEQWFHFSDLEALLQKLVDDEAARLEKMVDDLEAEEYGRIEREESILQKESRVDFDWPHGV